MNQISNLLSFYSYQSNTKVRWQEIKGDINPAERIQIVGQLGQEAVQQSGGGASYVAVALL